MRFLGWDHFVCVECGKVSRLSQALAETFPCPQCGKVHRRLQRGAVQFGLAFLLTVTASVAIVLSGSVLAAFLGLAASCAFLWVGAVRRPRGYPNRSAVLNGALLGAAYLAVMVSVGIREWRLATLDAALNEVGGASPRYATAYISRAQLLLAKGSYRQALADYERAIQADTSNGDAYLGRAWLLATCPDAEIRNGQRALQSSLDAQNLGVADKARLDETLAAAYAEIGDFESAVKWQQEAVDEAPAWKAFGLRSTLAKYQDGKARSE